MLSSRKSKKYKMKLFSPSSVNGCDPNYYQMKGRIIQQTPYYMHNPETEMITAKKLDKMYKTLIKYKYNIPRPPPLPFTCQFSYNVVTADPPNSTYACSLYELKDTLKPLLNLPENFNPNQMFLTMYINSINIHLAANVVNFTYGNNKLGPHTFTVQQSDIFMNINSYDNIQCIESKMASGGQYDSVYPQFANPDGNSFLYCRTTTDPNTLLDDSYWDNSPMISLNYNGGNIFSVYYVIQIVFIKS